MAGAFFWIRMSCYVRFNIRVQIQGRLITRCAHTLPEQRRGKNTIFAMGDFALAAFAPFFPQSPCFLAHQRQL
jgi:hypothetical protein